MSKPNARGVKEPVPVFATEDQERDFWDQHDTTDYVRWREGRWAVFPDLKPSTETISLRLPAALLADLKLMANKRDVPYQSLLKVFLAERVAQERTRDRRRISDPGRVSRGVRSKSTTRAGNRKAGRTAERP